MKRLFVLLVAIGLWLPSVVKAGTVAEERAITTQKKEESIQKMNRFVSQLMSKMTLDEKIGQLNLSGAGNLIPGQVKNSDVAKSVSTGQVGAILSLRGLEVIRELQNVAVKKTRLGIPLLFGLDVIHGYETTFPIPLALSCSWDMEGIKILHVYQRKKRVVKVSAGHSVRW